MLQSPDYAVLESLAKEATDILEEIADHWTLESSGDNNEDEMKSRIEAVIKTARKLWM